APPSNFCPLLPAIADGRISKTAGGLCDPSVCVHGAAGVESTYDTRAGALAACLSCAALGASPTALCRARRRPPGSTVPLSELLTSGLSRVDWQRSSGGLAARRQDVDLQLVLTR